MKKKPLQYFILFFVLFFCASTLQAKEKFVLVIDAGHGGKDPGAQTSRIDEKEINLSVALKLGDLIESNFSDVKVVYTRKSDRFIELDERANIANRVKADLFMSIHSNAVKKGNYVKGTETYTLGLARTDENLEVAMRENSAILLEDNYLQKYEGFDPNSSESYIIFEFMQNKHMEQSISLASKIQKSFTQANRIDKGVRQAGLLVLRKTSMPSVLVELGFMTNREEEQFISSSDGQNKLAKSLYNAFIKYRREYDRKQGGLPKGNTQIAASQPAEVQVSDPEEKTSASPVEKPVADSENKEEVKADVKTEAKANGKADVKTTPSASAAGETVYRIQILTSSKKLPLESKLFKGYKDLDFYKEGGVIKYTYGETTSFNEIKRLRRKIAKDFKDAFIIAFKNGEKVTY